MMRHITVTGGYADFKTVVGLLGKPKAVFWWAAGPQQAAIAALLDDWTIVHVTVPKPDAPAPVAAPVDHGDPPSPFVPAAANAPSDKARVEGKPEGKADPGHGPGLGKPAAPPKTALETDFPGAIELPGGGIVFS